MIGVNVLVKELGVGTVSDEQGEYIIVNIKPGRYTIEVTYIGYSKVVLKDVVVNQNRTFLAQILACSLLATWVLAGLQIISNVAPREGVAPPDFGPHPQNGFGHNL